MRIIIDADACPANVLKISRELGEKYQIPVWTVANYHHNIESEHHIMVEDHPQAADIRLTNMAKEGDLVITHDLGLVALLLSKEVRCLSLSGREYRSHEMDLLLAEREIKARYRREGGRTKGPKKRRVEDDILFGRSLERVIREELEDTSL